MARSVFASRWLQAPLYFGLIVAQTVYVYHFGVELMHLVQNTKTVSETEIMLVVLGLIDVVMIANLLLMVIVGGAASTWGPVVGAAVLAVLARALVALGGVFPPAKDLDVVLFGVILILVLCFRPEGLATIFAAKPSSEGAARHGA